jgi:hypothetical protein
MAASRTRLIYFRVSEEELERFRSLAEKKGARSLSHLAREAMERMHRTQGGAQDDPATEPREASPEMTPVLLRQIHSLQDTVNRMHDRIQELSFHLRRETEPGNTEGKISR